MRRTQVSLARANTALAAIHADGHGAAESHRRAIGNFVFWTLAEMCDEFKLPFDLMIGVNRGVYEAGVYQGRDLYDSRVSLIQYKELFNAFPQVTFPISVLASVTNQELASYAWIFPERGDQRPLVVLATRRRSSSTTWPPGWKRCRGPSRSATTATCTSWSSPCRSSPCTSGFWPRCWPSGS